MASDQAGDHSTWIVDSGASHDIISNLQNLSLHFEYGGKENIMINNGNDIPITHVGSIILGSPTTIFSLDNVLCAPLIYKKKKKNLLFVYQFCNQNNISIEFFLDFFIVKDFSHIISYFGVYLRFASSSALIT